MEINLRIIIKRTQKKIMERDIIVQLNYFLFQGLFIMATCFRMRMVTYGASIPLSDGKTLTRNHKIRQVLRNRSSSFAAMPKSILISFQLSSLK